MNSEKYEYREEVLKALINRTLNDTANPFIRSGTISAGGGDARSRQCHWSRIRNSLEKWERAGFLTILKDPELADDMDECVEMHQYIDHKSPIPGFLNYDK